MESVTVIDIVVAGVVSIDTVADGVVSTDTVVTTVLVCVTVVVTSLTTTPFEKAEGIGFRYTATRMSATTIAEYIRSRAALALAVLTGFSLELNSCTITQLNLE